MRRLGKIFREDGRTVIVAMDHGMGMNVNPALDRTGEILEAIVAGGADAVLTTYGIASKYADILRHVGLILRCDGGYSAIPSAANGHPRMLFSVEDALRLGADAVACNGFPGTPTEQDCMKNVAELSAQGRAWGMPVMAEMLPGGFGNEVPKTVENVRLAARTGCEYGASIIKTTFTGTPEEFRGSSRPPTSPWWCWAGKRPASSPTSSSASSRPSRWVRPAWPSAATCGSIPTPRP